MNHFHLHFCLFFFHFGFSQKELFLGKADLGSPPRSERKLSTSSSSMKTKWLKAFRSLKPATAIAGTVKYVYYNIRFNYRIHSSERMHSLHLSLAFVIICCEWNYENNAISVLNGIFCLFVLFFFFHFTPGPNVNFLSFLTLFFFFFFFLFSFHVHCRKNDQSSNGRRVFDGENHNLQEYTYKKITPCDVCSQVLRGKKIEKKKKTFLPGICFGQVLSLVDRLSKYVFLWLPLPFAETFLFLSSLSAFY